MRRLVTAVLVLSFCLVGPPAFPQGQGAGGGAQQTVITKAVDGLNGAAQPVLTIDGARFGTSPSVFLGTDTGGAVELDLLGPSTDTHIVALLPASLEAGTYLLLVQAGTAAPRTAMMDVTIGGVNTTNANVLRIGADEDQDEALSLLSWARTRPKPSTS